MDFLENDGRTGLHRSSVFSQSEYVLAADYSLISKDLRQFRTGRTIPSSHTNVLPFMYYILRSCTTTPQINQNHSFTSPSGLQDHFNLSFVALEHHAHQQACQFHSCGSAVLRSPNSITKQQSHSVAMQLLQCSSVAPM